MGKIQKTIIAGLLMSLAVASPEACPDALAQSARRNRKAKTEAAAPANKKGTSAGTQKKGTSSQAGKRNVSSSGGKKAETSADVKKRQAATNREIQQTKQQIEANEKKVRSGLAELSRLKSDIEISDRKVSALGSKVATLDNNIKTLENKIEEGNREVARMRSEYLKAVKKMRLTKQGNSTLAFIFSADSFNQGLRRMRYLRQFSKWKEQRSAEINRRAEELRQQTAELEKSRKEQQDALIRQKAAKEKLQQQSKQQDALVASLRSEGAALNSHLAKKQAEANQLKGQIAALIAAEERKAAEERARQEEARRIAAEKAAAEKAEAERKAAEKAEAARLAAEKAAADKQASAKASADKAAAEKLRKEQAKKEEAEKARIRKEQTRKEAEKKEQQKKEAIKPEPATPLKSTSHSGGNFAAAKGNLPRPVDGHFRIASPFGRHSLPELPDVVYDNPGIDIEVSSGAMAKAVFAGKVSGVYMIPGFGNVVIVNHGNHYTVYGNLSSVSVKVGDEVTQGKGVGKVANDPDNPSYGSLHFEVWRNRDKLDPSGWIR